MRLLALAVVAIGVLLLLNIVQASSEPDSNLMRRFLELQYVQEAGLLRAATIAYPDNETIYVANDNLLAARALAVLGSPLASKVLTALNNKHNGGWNGKVDILLGKDIPDAFYSMYNENVTTVFSSRFNTTFTVCYEKPDTANPIENWEEYADLLVYRALDRLLWGSRPGAEECLENLLNYGMDVDSMINGLKITRLRTATSDTIPIRWR